MILFDLLKLQTENNCDIEYIIDSKEASVITSLEHIEYRYLIKEVLKWRIEIVSENKANMKIWLS